MIGLFVQLRVQRHDAAIRIFQLAIQEQQLFLALAQFGQRPDQLAILLLDFLVGARRRLPGQLRRDARKIRTGHDCCPRRQDFLQQHVRAGTRCRADVDLVHQPMDADDPDSHAGLRAVPPAQHLVEIGNTRAFIAHLREQQLGCALAFQREFDFAAAGVAESIACNFGDGRGDARLVLRIKTDEAGNLACALARYDDVLFVVKGYRKESLGHQPPVPLFMTTTVTSSRPRSWSRYRTPAIRAACCAMRPG